MNFANIQTPVSASACHSEHDTRRLCWPLFQCQHHTAIGCNQASTCRPSPRAPLHVLGMLRLMPTELVHSFLFRSYVSFCLYGPFNCISFLTLSRKLSAFSLCSSGLISALLIPSTIYLFMKISLSPYTVLCG